MSVNKRQKPAEMSRKSVSKSPLNSSQNQNRRHCHVCRSPKDVSKIVTCSSGKRSHIFCSSCVERRLQASFQDLLNDPTWICPKCHDCCPCSKCRKKEKPKPQTTSPESLSPTSSSEDTDAALTLLDIKHSPIISWANSPHRLANLTIRSPTQPEQEHDLDDDSFVLSSHPPTQTQRTSRGSLNSYTLSDDTKAEGKEPNTATPIIFAIPKTKQHSPPHQVPVDDEQQVAGSVVPSKSDGMDVTA
eukprot:c3774_g1_i1.p1 GENE.c3774_g1_i1~~c3774_g1_i1.p1  ORF type:complete len:245 (-),score=15.80 c3774_g1_i1:119-853(-)